MACHFCIVGKFIVAATRDYTYTTTLSLHIDLILKFPTPSCHWWRTKKPPWFNTPFPFELFWGECMRGNGAGAVDAHFT